MATFVNSLNGISGITSLTSTDSSVLFGFSPLNNDINLIASKAGNEGGVTSLNAITGSTILQSSGSSIVISYPNGQFPSGHVINLEAVAGGIVGINTINNIPADGAHNFTILGAKGNTILSGPNEITVEGPNSILSINSITPLGSDIELLAGTGITITNGPNNTITIESSGGAGVNTINGQSPIAGDIEIVGGANVQVMNIGGNQISIDLYGLSSGVQSINNSVPPGSNITLTPGAGISITTISQGDIEISATGGGGAGINTINTISPLAGEFSISAGGTIAITPGANGITIADSGIASINSTGPDINQNYEILPGTGITVDSTVAGQVTINATGGGGGIASINGSTPATSDFILTAGTGISITTLGPGDISIAQSAAPVTEMNGIFPSAGTIDIVGGGGISVSSVGNTITVSTTGAAGVPGFEYVSDGTLTFVGSGVGNVTAPYTLYYSGVAPNQIATLQIDQSALPALITAAGAFGFTTQLPITGYTPKYTQGGMCLGIVTGVSFYPMIYDISLAGVLTIYIIAPYPSGLGVLFGLYGMSVTFPITLIPPFPFDMLFENQLIATTTLPVIPPTSTQSLTLTIPAYIGAPTIYNIADTTFPGGNCATVALAATTQTEVNQFGGVGGSIFTQYTFGTATVVQTVNLQTATGILDLYTLAMCCPATNDKCYALCFSATSNAHYIIDVFSSPLVDLNLGIPGPAMLINSMSCSDTILVLCNTPTTGPSVFRSYTLVASPSSITFLVDDTAVPNTISFPATFSWAYNNTVIYGYVGIAPPVNVFWIMAASTLDGSAPYSTFAMPAGYNITRCIGNDPYGNVLVAGEPTGGGTYSIFAFDLNNQNYPQTPAYEISGVWGSQIPLIAR